MKAFFLFATLFLFASCAESEKDRITHLVNEWQGKEILFPVQSVFTVQGRDTVDFFHVGADYIIMRKVHRFG